MQKSLKREKIIELVRNGVDVYLSRNVEKLGFVHIIDVNMSEDLKTAYIYVGCPVEKNTKNLENSIVKDKKEISEIFREMFSSKFMPKTKFVCIKDSDVEF